MGVQAGNETVGEVGVWVVGGVLLVLAGPLGGVQLLLLGEPLCIGSRSLVWCISGRVLPVPDDVDAASKVF